ncbi:MAG: ribosome small subunit-dependent GTPase A [Clostridia bacterium]|nr:ribosome small subunit-dependent GTPase A [Clostridia bacterium]
MQYEETGRLIQGLSGLYEICLDKGTTPLSGGVIFARAKGKFRHEELSPLVGDRVRVCYDESAFVSENGAIKPTADGGGAVIAEILARRNALIRPPMANLDMLFITFAAARPAPVTETIDKLISIAEFHGIEPVIVVGKQDLDPDAAERLCTVYRTAGFSVFAISAENGVGIDALRDFLCKNAAGKTVAFAGASGVGKSTLLNALFPELGLETGAISQKIQRGRHTTRRVTLYPMADVEGAFVADTPGFSMLDFVRFDFFGRDDLPETMREFAPYLGCCRYKKCTHTKEEGCAVLEAVRAGHIAPSRHASFVEMFEALKNKQDWSRK